MAETEQKSGIVLSAAPYGEYDRRLCLLTAESGKITAFVRGARRQNGKLLAAANPFASGSFTLAAGKSAYTLIRADIKNYFRELAADVTSSAYGFYFLEFASFLCQENTNERDMCNLLYESLSALMRPQFDARLVRAVFELRAIQQSGFGPMVRCCIRCGREDEPYAFSVTGCGMLCPRCAKQKRQMAQGGSLFILHPGTWHAMRHALFAPLQNLYTFSLSEPNLLQLSKVTAAYLAYHLPHDFKSLKVIDTLADFDQAAPYEAKESADAKPPNAFR